ncbi:MAG: response regulator [Candidatus Competibacterales bacterium]
MTRILLVDDDEDLAELLGDYLACDGFVLDAAHDGATGLDKARDGPYRAVILDVMMPELGGFEVLRRLRQHSTVPVLMLTAKGEDVDRIVGLELGADDYLPKPCNPRELSARLRAILRRSGGVEDHDRGGQTPAVVVDDLTLKPSERRAYLRGDPVTLTGAEFSLLEALLHWQGQVVTKATLCEQALGRPLGAYDRSIDMHISNLRKKLGPARNGEPRIKAVRGAGYIYVC